MKKYREFTVTPGMAGFKVKIGCSEVYFGDAKALDLAISAYLKDPEAMEKKMTAGDIRNNPSPAGPVPYTYTVPSVQTFSTSPGVTTHDNR